MTRLPYIDNKNGMIKLWAMKVTIEKDGDGSYIAYNTDDCKYVLLGRGNSVKDAKSDFMDSVAEIKANETEQGIEESSYLNSDIEFSFDLSSLFEYYSMINVSALARYIGINPALMRAYKKGDTYVSDKQLKKIEDGIRHLGNDLASLSIV